jgi:hypothetical protein
MFLQGRFSLFLLPLILSAPTAAKVTDRGHGVMPVLPIIPQNGVLGNASRPHENLKPVPQFVLDHAPLLHLYSKEPYWPSTMESHLEHTIPHVGYEPITGENSHPNVNNLARLNKEDGDLGWDVFLNSKDNILDNPDWMTSEYGKPVFPDGPSADENGNPVPGRSVSPVVLIVVEKENGIVDAFWHFFYSYNLGNGVFGLRFGNHVGDWEHLVVRFINGQPKEMYFSAHAWGSSYTFEAVEKYGKRV